MKPTVDRAFLLAVLTRLVSYFALSAVALLGAIAYLEYRKFSFERDKLEEQETLRIRLASRTLTEDLKKIVANLRTLAASDVLADYLDQPTQENRIRTERLFQQMASSEGIYDQIRLIDLDGRENIRLDLRQGKPVAAPQDRLQDKSARPYFIEGLKLDHGGIFVSRLDLNVEHGAIEVPIKPTLRLLTPVYDRQGTRRGLLALNYLANIMLRQFEDTMSASWGAPMLINRDGFWLYDADEKRRWAWMFSNQDTFAAQYPAVWSRLLARDSGAVFDNAGLFMFATVYPELSSANGAVTIHHDRFWKIVSHVPPEAAAYSLSRGFAENRGTSQFLLVVAAVLALMLAWLRTGNEFKAAALKSSEERLNAMVDNATAVVYMKDLKGRFLLVNRYFERVFGFSRGAVLGKSVREIFGPEVADPLDANDRMVIETGKVMEFDEETRIDGARRAYISVKFPLFRPDGRMYALAGISTDITERKRAEEELRQAATVFESSMEGIVITDDGRRIISVNNAFTAITGYTADEVRGRDPRVLASGRHDQDFYRGMWAALDNAGQWQGEIWNRRKDGGLYPAWENISVVRDSTGRVVNYVAVLTDISAIKEVEERLHHLAHHDPLTGLPNRLLLHATLDRALEHARRHGTRIALLFLDLDRFKLINDTLGHQYGDRLLRAAADRLRQHTRAEDMVARLGGDEFVILLDDIAAPEDVSHIAEKIIESLAEPIDLGDQKTTISASVGISLYPDDARDREGLLKAADAAMYGAKESGKNRVQFYTARLTARAFHRLAIENGLRNALANQELVVFYQPQVSLREKTIVGVEALLRWRHPTLGLVFPDQFIPIAEESALIDSVGEWLFHAVFKQLEDWQTRGVNPRRVAMNVSMRQMRTEGRVEDLLGDCMSRYRIKRDLIRLEIELTESVLQTAPLAIDTVRRLNDLGVSLAIDDFGIGYSSLNSLKHLPIQRLKIDRSFIRDAPDDRDDAIIAEAIIALGHSLHLEVVAEGVETQAQLRFLQERGCDEVQGFYYSPPISASELETLLASPHRRLATE